MLKQTFTREEIREALQVCAPSIWGYNESTNDAFKRGWDANAQRIWELLELTNPEPTE